MEENEELQFNPKRKKTARGLLLGGLIISILYQILTVLLTIGSIIVLVFAELLAKVIVAVFASMFSGGSESATSSAVNSTSVFATYWWVPLLFGLFALFAVVTLAFSIVAFVLFNVAKNKKLGIVAAVFAISAGIDTLFIPLELIGGILTLRLTNEEFAYRKPKKKKEKEEPKDDNTEVIDLTEK